MKINIRNAAFVDYGEADVRFDRYECNGRVAMSIYQNGQMQTRATVNLPDQELPKDHVFIKNHAENDGLMIDLVENNIISSPIRMVRSGHVLVPECKLLVTPEFE